MTLPTPTELHEFREEARRRHDRPVCDQTVDRWLLEQLGRILADGWRRAWGRVR